MKIICILLVLLSCVTYTYSQINLASGVSGTITGVAQSFNETRGVDVNVISPVDLPLTSMTLHRFFSGTGDSAYVGARIYNPSNGMLLASNMVSVYNVVNGAVSVPISYTLVSGRSYRISFFCGGPNPPTHNSAAEFQPGSLPYNESSNLLEITHAYAYPADTFPVYTNTYVPIITLNLETSDLNTVDPVNAISVYPNPASQKVFIGIGNENIRQVIVSFFDLQGKEVPVETRLLQNAIEIERNGLASGVYFFQLKLEQRILKTGKLILN